MIADMATQRKVKRRHKILEEGYICKHYTLVVKGCIRRYDMDEKGSNHNIQFATENDWIAVHGGFDFSIAGAWVALRN